MTADLTDMYQALEKTAIFKHRFLTTTRQDFHTTIYIFEGWMPRLRAEEVYEFFYDLKGPMYFEKRDELLGRPMLLNKDEHIYSAKMNSPMCSQREYLFKRNMYDDELTANFSTIEDSR